MDRSGGHVALATPAAVTHRTAEEALGLGYLASVLRRDGFTVTVLDAWLSGLTAAELADRLVRLQPPPIMVGLSCYRSNITAAIETLDRIRALGSTVPVVVGGFGPTFHPEDFVRAGFDVVVRGEGERTVLELAAHYATGAPALAHIPGIVYQSQEGTRITRTPARAAITDLDSLPFPARDTLALTLSRGSPVHVASARGCLAACTFCSIVAFERVAGRGPTWRQRSIGDFVDELQALAAVGVQHVKVIDDSLIEPPRDARWCEELADAITARGLRLHLRGQIRADRVTPDVVRHLRRAGFWSFACGIENFASTALKRMAKRADLDANLAALRVLHEAEMVVQAGHILFDQATTIDELTINLREMRRHLWTISKGVFSEMYAAEGTAFTRALRRDGLLAQATPVAGSGGLGNAGYQVVDPAARAVHAGLKHWQRSHGRIYDKAVDPLAAPKAIDVEQRRPFRELSIMLRRRDLDVLAELLALASSGATPSEAVEHVDSQIIRSAAFYAQVDAMCSELYAASGLVYDAGDNPFLC